MLPSYISNFTEAARTAEELGKPALEYPDRMRVCSPGATLITHLDRYP
jgi:hypothetical protein